MDRYFDFGYDRDIAIDIDREIKKLMDIDRFFGDDFFGEPERDIFADFDKYVQRLVKDFYSELYPGYESSRNIETAVRKAERERGISPATRIKQGRDAPVYHVPAEFLPHGIKNGESWRALGVYDPNSHKIYIADNLPSYIEKFVYHHEIAHSLGIMDEDEADRYATQKCGYYINRHGPAGFSLN